MALATPDDLTKQLCRYVDIDSTSGQERHFLRTLERELGARGYRTIRQPLTKERWNLLALPEGDVRLLFSTHVDTVPPWLPARLEGGAVWGRGACDTKGGLVAMLEAAERLDPARQWLGFLLVVGEEVDHAGALHARELDVRPEAIVLCEPTTGNLVAGQKGILKLSLHSSGEAAHSAFPELGRDALAPLLDSLERLRRADYPRDPVLGPTTLNIGVLEAGLAANITPPAAHAELLYRAVGPLDALLGQVRALCEPSVDVVVQTSNPALRLPTVPGFSTEVIAFNTDAWYLQALAPVYLMGPGDIRVAHGSGEHIRLDELVSGVDDYVRLVRSLGMG
jgi:acetylornithine deacetylase